MDSRIERIPIPPAQQWERLRERTLPAICLCVTLALCGWMWQRQGRVAPFALGVVEADTLDVRSPVDGTLLPVDGRPNGRWPLFAEISRNAVVARVKPADGDVSAIDLPSPIGGVVTEVLCLPGEWVAQGEKVLEISSKDPAFILCHVPSTGAPLPRLGSEVAVRLRGNGSEWAAATIEGISPIVDSTTVYDESGAGGATRGFPVRIAIPSDLTLHPGAFVDVRFPPTLR